MTRARRHSGLLFLCLLVVALASRAATYAPQTVAFSWDDPSSHTDVVWTTAAGSSECSTGQRYPTDDDISAEIPLGFSFTFGGATYTSVRIQSNGRLQFSNSFCGYGTSRVSPREYTYPMPDTRLVRTLRAYGGDLDPSAGGRVTYATLGSAPNRRFVVTWLAVPEWNAAGSRFDVQAVLYEDGTFEFRYGTISNPSGGHGQIGWEIDTTDYGLYVYSDITALSGQAIRFSPHTPAPTAYYRMDEKAWTGVAGEVQDSSGNANHGDKVGAAQTTDGKVCRGGRMPTDSSAVDTKLDVDATLGPRGTITFWYRADDDWDDERSMLLDASANHGGGGADKNFYLVNRNGRLRFVLEDSNDEQLDARTGTLTYAEGTWHHVAITWDLTEDADWLQVYVDGNRLATNRGDRTGPLAIANALGDLWSLYLGDNRTGGVGGPDYTTRSARGTLDEVRVYGGEVLSRSQILDDMNATHACPSYAAVAYYAMDELSWNGTANEVRDGSGNGNHGTAVGSADTVDPGKVCRGGDIPTNTSDSAQDAVDTGLDVDSDVGPRGTISFWYKADERWRNGGRRMLFDASTRIYGNNNDKYFFLQLNDGRLEFRFEDSTDDDFRIRSSRYSFGAGEWVHIAVTWDYDSGLFEIYVNGTLDESERENVNGTIPSELGTLYLGDNRSSYHPSGTGNSAAGVIDEARIYDYVQGQAEIQADMNATHPCAALAGFTVDVGTGSASTCTPHAVTITAQSTAGGTLTSYTGTIGLSTSSGHGTWSVNAASGTLSDPTPDDGAATYTFVAADNGSVVLDLANVHADDLTITVTDAAAGVSSTSAVVSFRDNAFVVTPTTCTGASCPGTGSTELVAGRGHGFRAELWRRDPSTGNCAIATAYDGSKGLKAWVVRDTADPGGAAPSIAGTAL
ncbi:MAG TPA: LamG domain-containing protein, partial [Thiotrichales bacterium]|nr:LamG domain-containing protein [Thiotrichales bacterium]